jgi:hypothetical protein
MAFKNYVVWCVLVIASSGCTNTPNKPQQRTPFEWVTQVCSREVQSAEARAQAIQTIEREQGFTFQCPQPGEEPYIRWLDPEKAALARQAALEREQPEPITPEMISWINDMCARPPSAEREQLLREIRARGINATCPDE